MPKQSAGLLVYRKRNGAIEVLLAHPGGPFWTKKEKGAWTIPKGEVDPDEALENAAKREFTEETNFVVSGPMFSLGSTRLKSGKVLHVWAIEADPDLTLFASNTFSMEWPPRYGTMQSFPEVDRIQFFGRDEARKKINPAQMEFLNRLEVALETGS